MSWRLRRLVPVGLLAVATLITAGCGAGMSKSDIRKYAIRRPSDEEVEDSSSSSVALVKPAPQISPAEPAPDVVDRQASPPTAVERPHPATAAAPTSPADSSVVPSAVPSPSPSGSSTGEATVIDRTRPQTAVERAEFSAQNMEQIAAALEAYRQAQGTYPPRAITVAGRTELLSWRVALLPYLGYQELYRQFNLEQPWNSAFNKKLVAQIPPVYQSPERFDTKTNYLAVTGGSTVFSSARPALPGLIEDGPENTAFVVEVDDELAVEWTKPQEWQFSRATPHAGLGALRNGHFYVAWGGGAAGGVVSTTPRRDLMAMFTADAGEAFSSVTVSAPLDADLFRIIAQADAAASNRANPGAAIGNVAAGGAPTTGASVAEAGRNVASPANTLSAEYASSGKIAYQLGRMGDALRWYYASLLLQNGRSNWHDHYRWVAGLRRPCVTVHYGIGVRGDPRNDHARSSSGRRGRGATRERNRIVSAIGKPGEEFVELVEQHAAETAPRWLASGAAPTSRGRNQLPPIPVTFLGFGNRTELTQKAVTNACDVLFLLEPDVSGGRVASRSLEIHVYDLAGGRRVLRLPTLNWIDSDAGVKSLRRSEAFRTAKWDLEDALKDKLSFGEWPSALNDNLAANRTESLAEVKLLNPLAALTEMSLYRSRGLIGGRELLDGMRGLIGAEQAEELLLGADRERRRVLRQWLPLADVDEVDQLVQRTRRREEDDD